MAYKKREELELELQEALKKIKELERELEYQKSDNRRTLEFAVQEIEEAKKGVQKIKNERGAGRKKTYTEQDKASMQMYKIQGKSYREIASMYNCSVGTVHKLINEN